MKKSNLKSLINHIIREAVVNKLGEGQPVGGVKNDHPFDTGRNNVMKDREHLLKIMILL